MGVLPCEMKYYGGLKAEMEAIQQQVVESKKNERAGELKQFTLFCKESCFAPGAMNSFIAEGINNK